MLGTLEQVISTQSIREEACEDEQAKVLRDLENLSALEEKLQMGVGATSVPDGPRVARW